MRTSSPIKQLPSFSMRERVVIALGVIVLVAGVVSIYRGPIGVVFYCLTTLGILGIVLFLQFRDLREAARILHESEERYRLLINEVQDYAIFGLDPDGNVRSWNQGAERITGYEAEEIVGKPFSVLRAPGEDGKTPDISKIFEQVRREGRHQEEAWQQSKAGRRFLANTTLTPLLSASGALRGYSIVMCDITARKQAERELVDTYRFIERITDTIPDIVFICELTNLRKIYINDESRAILGYSAKQMDALGTEFFEKVLHPEDRAAFAGLRQRFEAAQGKPVELQCRMKHSSGEWRWLNCRAVVFARSEEGAPSQCLGIAQDITALKRAKEDTLRLEHAALERQRLALLGELSASVAHELRNPLQGLLNCVEELHARASGDGSLSPTVNLMEEGLQRMDRISERLLGLARNHDGPKVPYDVAQCIDGSCAFIRARAQKHRVTLETKIEPGLPLVPMLPERVSEALLNLIGNALDACPEGGRITVEARKSQDPAGMLEIRVSDTGKGIPADAQEHIFDMFFTTKSAGKGTGLGMTIVRKNIEAHGGTVELVETSSHGTTFRALLPLK